MEYEFIQVENQAEGKIRVAFLNNPETFNSLNPKMLMELADFVQAANAAEEVRCIAISGRGKAFCSGQNLQLFMSPELATKEKPVVYVLEKYYNPLISGIYHSKKPVVALVNGPAVGAGAMLSLLCDITLATESTYFSQAFVNIGLIPDTAGTYWLPKLVGRQQANYLAFTGKKISSAEAKNLGLISDSFPDNEFQQKSAEVLEVIANQPTAAISLIKKAFNESYTNDLDAQLALEAEYQQKAAETADFREGVQAFMEKRKANFIGK